LRLEEEKSKNSGINSKDLFEKIDKESTGFIDFENLLGFFKNLGFFPYEEEIIYILRRIDTDEDGRLNISDLEGVFTKNKQENVLRNQRSQLNTRRTISTISSSRSKTPQKYQYYPFKPIRKCLSPLKGLFLTRNLL